MKLSMLVLVILGMAATVGCAPLGVQAEQASNVTAPETELVVGSAPAAAAEVVVSNDKMPEAKAQPAGDKKWCNTVSPGFNVIRDPGTSVVEHHKISSIDDMLEISTTLTASGHYGILIVVDDESELAPCGELDMAVRSHEWPEGVLTYLLFVVEENPPPNGTVILDGVGRYHMVVSSDLFTR